MFVIFFVLWVIFNASFTLEIAIFGVIISALLLLFCVKFADYSMHKEKRLYAGIFKIIKYVIKLVIEVIKSNFAVMHLIRTQKEEIKPMLVEFDLPLTEDTTQALMANTITLTPGTITVELENGRYLVHCLDEDFAEGIETSDFVELIKSMEDKK